MINNTAANHRGAAAMELPTGTQILHEPLLNKGTAFTEYERDSLGLRGLLPPRVSDIEIQAQRIVTNFRKAHSDLERYVHLIDLEDRNETLFYYTLINNLEMMMPIVYTPTVGLACQKFGHIFRRPRGLFISAEDRGNIRDILDNWPHDDVRVIVVTDGERILGLGDLGASGMGIPVGKISLYTAIGGISPATTLPVLLDVGTNNEELRDDPLYLGLAQPRLSGEAYDALVDEFIAAVQDKFPKALIQFEDFGNHNAFRLLEKYRYDVRTFNDDIQGTAAVALAGILAAMRALDADLKEQKLLFLGAGEAGIGIGDLVVSAMMDAGLSRAEAMQRNWFVDSRGLVVAERSDLASHKVPYAHEHPQITGFLEAVEAIRPTAIIGVSGQPQTFTKPIIEAMAAINERPIVFALSNPTSKAECTAEQAYTWSKGRAVFASGSPFAPVDYMGQRFVPGQGNNAYIFPGVGLGTVVSEARVVTDEMFLAAARSLAEQTTAAELETGLIYPQLTRIREVSVKIATAVAELAYARGLARAPQPSNIEAAVRATMYNPHYVPYT